MAHNRKQKAGEAMNTEAHFIKRRRLMVQQQESQSNDSQSSRNTDQTLVLKTLAKQVWSDCHEKELLFQKKKILKNRSRLSTVIDNQNENL